MAQLALIKQTTGKDKVEAVIDFTLLRQVLAKTKWYKNRRAPPAALRAGRRKGVYISHPSAIPARTIGSYERVSSAPLPGRARRQRRRAGKPLEEIDGLGFPRQLAELCFELLPA